jgi:hypothetical protein
VKRGVNPSHNISPSPLIIPEEKGTKGMRSPFIEFNETAYKNRFLGAEPIELCPLFI